MEKLVKIQSELKAPKNQRNNFGKYNYRSCEDILEAVKPLLLKYNCSLTVSDEVKEVGGITFVEASSRIWDNELPEIELVVTAQAGIDINRKGMDVAQSFGSSSSYARKYSLNGLFLIDDTKDPDTQEPPTTKPTLKPKDTLTKERFEKALETIKAGKYTVEKLKAEYQLTDLQTKALLLL